ncbi:MAG: SRPBCC domain-containing protein [Gemmatimonadaceae bacterium]
MSISVPDETTPIVVVTEEIAASPSFVFETLLDVQELPHWFHAPGGGETSDWSLDPRPGGEWSATTKAPDGSTGRLEGEFIEVDVPNSLEFTWHDSDDAAANGIVRFTLDEMSVAGEQWTRLTVTHVTSSAAQSVGSSALRIDWMLRLCNFSLHLTRYLVAASA